MATFACIHGAGGRGSDWRLVAAELEARGHEVVAPDLPCDEPAGLDDYADAVIAAIGDRPDVVLVAHSLGGLTAPVVADRIPVEALVFVTAIVALPGEPGGEWWGNSGHAEAYAAQDLPDDADETIFLHDVPADVLAASAESREQTGEVMDDPSPLEAWPDVPTTFLVCRDDRFFPAPWMTDLVRHRLGIEPVVIPGGHCPYLSEPVALADAIERAWKDRAGAPPVTLAASPV
ncbi:alpha/beta fold hydrolase [Aquihabitans daechungensis]|uniref:alpha/beta fold hydrolase n=1 Tax=Aquihabitans daechungensis TaxID=1052257 RepID=UPI003B9F855D